MPEIEEEVNLIFSAAERDISKIYKEIDNINVELAGKDYKTGNIPFWQRVAGVAGGLVLGDIGLAFAGGVNGIGKEFAKTAAFEFGAGFVLAMLGLFNPITLIATIVGVFLFNLGKGSSRAMETLKANISEEAVKSMTKEAEDQAAQLADGIETKMKSVAAQIIDSVSKELADIDRQVQAIIKEKQKGEKDVELRKKELEECETRIHGLNARLDALIFTLVGVE